MKKIYLILSIALLTCKNNNASPFADLINTLRKPAHPAYAQSIINTAIRLRSNTPNQNNATSIPELQKITAKVLVFTGTTLVPICTLLGAAHLLDTIKSSDENKS